MGFVPTDRPRTDGGRAIRFLLLLAIVATTLAAACPARRDTIDVVPADADRARVGLAGTVTLQQGRVRVTFVEMERGGSFADVTLTIATDGSSVTDEVTVVRQTDYSDAIRVDGWVVVVAGFPGVDSVEVVAWRE